MTILAHTSVAVPGLVAAVLVGLLLAAPRLLRGRPRDLLAVALACIAFQAFHSLEHVLQMGHWVVDPQAGPWLSSWALAGRDALAGAGKAAVGNELLHLLGNLVFLAGLRALAAAAPRLTPDASHAPRLRTALTVQAGHVAEHVLLTATVLATGIPAGVSTLFGLLPPGSPAAGGFRVWLHFTINLVATCYALAALRELPVMTATARRLGLRWSSPAPSGASEQRR